MRVSEYFELDRTQPYLDFVDVPLHTDLEVFVSPVAIRSLTSTWASDCISLLQSFFETVIDSIAEGDKDRAVSLLASLNERNEFHLGYSKGKSKGHGFGFGSSSDISKAISESKAAESRLLSDLEDACLMVEGIGPDMVSDAVCNIIRGPLIAYTQEMCQFYGIPLTPGVSSGPIWNPEKEDWITRFENLPVTNFGKLILVPKIIVRFGVGYNLDSYYRHYLMPVMQDAEKKAGTGLVHTLRDGRKRVCKKDLAKKYGSGKSAVIDQTVKYPEVLKAYKESIEKKRSHPISHREFADVEGSNAPDWNWLQEELEDIPSGNKAASEYEDHIEKILTALFYPSLTSPSKQTKVHNGRKIIDLTYINSSEAGFFRWVSLHYPASHVFIECKNYSGEVGNPEFDQLSGRFSPSRGVVGFLIVRKLNDKDSAVQRCIDTAKDGRGYMIPLDDSDLRQLIKQSLELDEPHSFPLLKDRFDKLVL